MTLIISVGKNPKCFIASDRFSHNFMIPNTSAARHGQDFQWARACSSSVRGEANFSRPELHLTICTLKKNNHFVA